MHLLAPGVFIWTTDIAGAAGYESGDFTKRYNGTSSSTPAVAAVAALMISANPALSATSVRNLLATTARRIQGQSGWTKELGWGRLDAGAAVAAAKAVGAPAKKGKKKPPAKKRKKKSPAKQPKKSAAKRASSKKA
jgi:subtilisin family serine protease